MPSTYKVLGQSAPAATTETSLYTVPAATTAIASTLTICNFSTTPTTFRAYVAVANAATASKQYLYYDVAIGGNDTFCATLGLTLAATDVLKVYCGANTLAFNLFGQELS